MYKFWLLLFVQNAMRLFLWILQFTQWIIAQEIRAAIQVVKKLKISHFHNVYTKKLCRNMYTVCQLKTQSLTHDKIFILYILAGFNNKISLKQVAFWGS